VAKLRLEISPEEVEQRTQQYRSLTGRSKPRLSLKEWIAREIASGMSAATSVRGGYAVAATLRPVIEAELEFCLCAEKEQENRGADGDS